MAVYQFDPLQDFRWPEFLQSHPAASVFHTPGWLEALRRTYGYEPTVFTTASSGEELRIGIVFCRVKDCLRGCRMVSVPLSDYCQPLVDSFMKSKPSFVMLGDSLIVCTPKEYR